MELIPTLAAATVSVAAILDIRSRRIPNWISGTALLVGVVLHVWQSGPSGVLVALAGGGLGLLMLLPLYAIRAMGAGDVKLLAGVGALLGPQVLVSVAVYAAIAGGVVSIVILARRRRLHVFVHEVAVMHQPPTRSGATAPYAVAIASGVYLSMLLPSLVG